MSRLLFAAARGARLQVMADNNWYGVTQIYMPFHKDARAVRIHPDDAHLQYGPISTALREMAKIPARPKQDKYWRMARDCYITELWGSWPDDEVHLSTFLLILAEALADEGR